MRTLNAYVASLFALAALACTDAPPAAQLGSHIEIAGSVSRVNTDDGPAWLGTEYARVIDTSGTAVCEGDWNVDAVDAGVAPCQGCELTLDVVRSVVRAIADDCEIDVNTSEIVTTSRYMTFSGFEMDAGQVRGRVLVADQASGPWREYAGGLFHGDELVYHRTVLPRDAFEHDVPDAEWEPRDLPEPPN